MPHKLLFNGTNCYLILRKLMEPLGGYYAEPDSTPMWRATVDEIDEEKYERISFRLRYPRSASVSSVTGSDSFIFFIFLLVSRLSTKWWRRFQRFSFFFFPAENVRRHNETVDATIRAAIAQKPLPQGTSQIPNGSNGFFFPGSDCCCYRHRKVCGRFTAIKKDTMDAIGFFRDGDPGRLAVNFVRDARHLRWSPRDLLFGIGVGDPTVAVTFLFRGPRVSRRGGTSLTNSWARAAAAPTFFVSNCLSSRVSEPWKRAPHGPAFHYGEASSSLPRVVLSLLSCQPTSNDVPRTGLHSAYLLGQTELISIFLALFPRFT